MTTATAIEIPTEELRHLASATAGICSVEAPVETDKYRDVWDDAA